MTIQYNRINFLPTLAFIGGPSLSIFALMASVFDYSSRSPSISPLVYVGVIITIIGILGLFFTVKNGTALIQQHLGGKGFIQWSQRLDGIRRGKQSVTENMMEDQARIAAMQIAGNMAARYIPNKQDVTIRYK